MNNRKLENYNSEEANMRLFIKIYNESNINKLKIKQKQESPDYKVEDSKGNIFGVEVTTLYYDPEEAKILHGRGNKKFHELEDFDSLINRLSEIINKKCIKLDKYKISYPCLLLIRNYSPIFDNDEILYSIKRMDIPKNKFMKIWIIGENKHNNWDLNDIRY